MPSDGMTENINREPKTGVCSPSMCGYWFFSNFCVWRSLNQPPLSRVFLSSGFRSKSFTHQSEGGGGGEKDDDRIEIGDCLAGDMQFWRNA